MPSLRKSARQRPRKRTTSSDTQAFFTGARLGESLLHFKPKESIFSQGDSADTVFYIRGGAVRLSVLSERGKEATLSLLGPGDFVGEGCLAADQPLRLATATAIANSSIIRIDKKRMLLVLHQEHALSDMFVKYLVTRHNRTQADLVDQLFNSSEKRLARALLTLAHFGKESTPGAVIPTVSQETLAEMVGTTRSRVNFFMNKFRKLGFIHYNGGLKVHSSLLSVILHE